MNSFYKDFNNKDVIIVGGSKGIGAGIANEFKKLDANVKIISKNNCDITSKKEIDAFFSEINKVDILINNAGINFCKKIEEIDIDEWNKVINTNLSSFFYIIKKSLPLMSRGSKIVNVSSIAGRSKSLVSGCHYTASKAGIIGLTRQLAQEIGSMGININCICPSQTLTPMLKESMNNMEIAELESKIPLGRVATIDEIVQPVIYLCSSGASYIHGACIDVNGGQL